MDELEPRGGGAGAGTLRRGDFLKGAAVAGAGATALGPLIDRAVAQGAKGGGSHVPSERGIYCNVTRILWITVNVSDLERSIDFYERTYPVTRAQRTNGPAQSFGSLGIKQGQFEGRVMRDSQPFQGRAIHLVQWKSPGPVGEPYKEANHVGFYRHHASATRSGLLAAHDRVVAPAAAPTGRRASSSSHRRAARTLSRSRTRTGRRWSGSAASTPTRTGSRTTSAPTTPTAATCGARTASTAT